ncbi:hypothetical protein CTheo_2596 [Ceratobasidium theobromae]|uniref:Effector protein n=1 Tax=Ceratobasidium theobromae TaxID=1582974 RepID=A0A5N5QQF8_9AGAM|nr:hypothetical protein CTheo_2596 [Ceratobasidium theobromae]
MHFFWIILPQLVSVGAHSALWHPSMYGFNVTKANDDRDNRPVVPLKFMDFKTWWMHGHMDAPPNKGDVFQLPAGQTVTTEIACTKAATSYWESGEGGDIRDGNNVCPNSRMAAFHTNGVSGLGGCGLAIAYKNDVHAVKPEDFAIFSVNHMCVWNRFTEFDVPAKLPECPGGKCICSFFWIHKADSGGEEMTNATSSVAIPPPKVPRYCPIDKTNCTVGAKQPFYWLQNEGNNMFNDFYDPPTYSDDYGFKNGAQNDLWDSLPITASASASAPTSNSDFPVGIDATANTPALNTTTPTSNHTEPTSSAQSTVPHILVDSSRQIRGCRARRGSESGQGNQRRNYVLRKRATRNDQKGRNWWFF